MKFKRCGVRVELDTKKFRLKIPIKPKARRKRDFRSILSFPFFVPENFKKIKDPVYLMYRNVSSLDKDKPLWRKYGVRYDLTLIRDGRVLRSYVRTAGHHHPGRYAEIYEVIKGGAVFTLQSKDLKEMRMVFAKNGEMVAIPPGFGHQTFNIGKSALLIGNLVCDKFKSDYSVYKKKLGGAFIPNEYLNREIRPFYNLNYRRRVSDFPKIKRVKGEKRGPLDKLFKSNPEKIADFLMGKGSL